MFDEDIKRYDKTVAEYQKLIVEPMGRSNTMIATRCCFPAIVAVLRAVHSLLTIPATSLSKALATIPLARRCSSVRKWPTTLPPTNGCTSTLTILLMSDC